ncbi:phosphoprotein phosphatase [Moniliophthora roreri MCA 2997]|uniref:Mitochondrial import inner membrane translocase subunit TIM50 n=2 Tax=Moniliophthora roreri TaxID=221103 RepID=V2WTX6_MONRO|nr:phosphoprotein phosphatase [Moniliophthora roreri MCA 2997]
MPEPALSPDYLSQASGSSQYIADPTSSRKLLVLDLNGTLLLRPKRSARTKGEDASLTRTRPVHSRPYIPSFREYLSHPKTLSWLDTMVWSSAQPHSVKDMVERCFGHRTCLKALWARDMLGLTPELYAKKAQTTKDLSMIWNTRAFTSSPSLASLVSNSNDAKLFHNAATTVLLDDSPKKARLQPWNHVCIREYGTGMRKADLDVWEGLRPKEKEKKAKKAKKAKKTMKALEVEAVDTPVTELVPPSSKGTYDETLLAVIGVLEALRHQSNVAAWIRSGGLLLAGERGDLATDKESDMMWFNDVQISNRWVEKGRNALSELGIAVESGVHG